MNNQLQNNTHNLSNELFSQLVEDYRKAGYSDEQIKRKIREYDLDLDRLAVYTLEQQN